MATENSSNAKATQKKNGRPAVVINEEVLEGLGKINCTLEEVAAVFKTTKRTIVRRFSGNANLKAVFERGVLVGKTNLRRLQWRHAQMPNSAGVQMTIHLSKHWLGETDKAALELSGRVDSTVEVASARERITRRIDDLAKRIESRVAGIAAAAGAATVSSEPV